MKKPRTCLEHDWYSGGIPGNVVVGPDVYLDTSYSFAAFHSNAERAMVFGEASGAYDRSSFVAGPRGRIDIGAFTCLNGTNLVCNERITIGAHCLLAWSVVVTDTWILPDTTISARREALMRVASDPARRLPIVGMTRPVVIEDNVWVGFGATILPGVTLGTGCVIGCKTVIFEDVPANAIVAGDPPRLIRFIERLDR